MPYALPEIIFPGKEVRAGLPQAAFRREATALPEVSELDGVRHYSRLSRMNYGLDTHFYPLGSCTMKYNPKINEDMARVPRFARLHPPTRPEDSPGARRRIHGPARALAAVACLGSLSLPPAAGAH